MIFPVVTESEVFSEPEEAAIEQELVRLFSPQT